MTHTSMLNSTRVSGQIDDDFLLRLVNAIEEACGVPYQALPAREFVRNYIDGDLFIAYEEVRQMFRDEYPDWYPEDEE